MREAQRGKRFIVIDDFLDDATLTAARNLMGRANFNEVESVISPEKDGSAFRSKGVLFQDELGGEHTAGGRPKVYDEIARKVHAERDFYGDWGVDWDRIGFAFWKYPAGSRLGWHNDAGGGRRGEFILFLHETWSPSWGGELMLLDEDPESLDWTGVTGGNVVTKMETLLSRCPTSPVAVTPKPNRLVLVKTETVHQIHRVDQTAGEALRCTLTGFVSRNVRQDGQEKTGREKLAAVLGGS